MLPFQGVTVTADSASLVIPNSTIQYEPGFVEVYVNNEKYSTDNWTANQLSTDSDQRITVTGLTSGDVVKVRAKYVTCTADPQLTFPKLGQSMQVIEEGTSSSPPKLGYASAGMIGVPYYFDGIVTQYQNVNCPQGSYLAGPTGGYVTGGGFSSQALTTGTVLKMDSDNSVIISGPTGTVAILNVPIGHSPGGTSA